MESEPKPRRQRGVNMPLVIVLAVVVILILAWISNPNDMNAVFSGLSNATTPQR